ncbi:MAG: excinuclease ABC subunit UvrB [Ruminococcaceae bacterium]|nr:excinuclease ABC subunit UvrB [Oscillospiraceae bacterium]
MKKFELVSQYEPTGDQPQAIEKLTEGIEKGYTDQVLLGVTGSGKTFTMANIISKVNLPTLVLAHNKTLAAQLYTEFKALFPNNAVEYFVSYYDYYQPEAYVPGKDVYIEKDASINNEIDKLRHSATSALFERNDVIVVSSVSCIYSLGSPEEYKNQVISLRPGIEMGRNNLIKKLVALQYSRNDFGFERNNFRVRGDTVDIFPSNSDSFAIRVEFFGDEIDKVSQINTVTGEVEATLLHFAVYPSTHYVVNEKEKDDALREILAEMDERQAYFEREQKYIEAQRIRERTLLDVEQLREIGRCNGIENYSRVLSRREPGSTPNTLLDYFPDKFLMFIDESHVTVHQVEGMGGGDYSRKKNLVDFGFRLPSAFDNRPLNFGEFIERKGITVYVSATPSDFEKTISQNTVEQIVRPTGLLDPIIQVRKTEGQIDDLLGEIKDRIKNGERTLVTTLTKKMAEDLSNYLCSNGVKAKYLHYDIKTMERVELLRQLRLGEFDVLVGINLLREGLDLPEVSLVVILDADKQGFLRSESSLIQTIGRAARNVNGTVIMYADSITKAMDKAITETNRRRKLQEDYNQKHGIIPKTIIKEVRDSIEISFKVEEDYKALSKSEKQKRIAELTKAMKEAASRLEFETAAAIRDKIAQLSSI